MLHKQLLSIIHDIYFSQCDAIYISLSNKIRRWWWIHCVAFHLNGAFCVCKSFPLVTIDLEWNSQGTQCLRFIYERYHLMFFSAIHVFNCATLSSESRITLLNWISENPLGGKRLLSVSIALSSNRKSVHHLEFSRFSEVIIPFELFPRGMHLACRGCYFRRNQGLTTSNHISTAHFNYLKHLCKCNTGISH